MFCGGSLSSRSLFYGSSLGSGLSGSFGFGSGFFCFFLSNGLGNIFVYLFLGFKTFFGFGHLCVFYFFFYSKGKSGIACN